MVGLAFRRDCPRVARAQASAKRACHSCEDCALPVKHDCKGKLR
jgi:hypothetical protein